jgi:hypothetical protein
MLAMLGIGDQRVAGQDRSLPPLPRIVANIVTLAAFAYVTMQVASSGRARCW